MKYVFRQNSECSNEKCCDKHSKKAVRFNKSVELYMVNDRDQTLIRRADLHSEEEQVFILAILLN